jgi:FKBP-type peptidyl-prolyl cis-trans isomerase (trigger factor)
MEDLLRSLRGLGLNAPRSSQLLDLITEQDDPQAQKRLAQLLALGRQDEEEDVLLSKDLIDAGVQALLENFGRAVQKEKELFKVRGSLRLVATEAHRQFICRQSKHLCRIPSQSKSSHAKPS